MAIKIAISNQKGGCGKTTTAICLAQELIKRDYRVLFIDSDSQCNSTSFYEAKTDGEATMMDVLCGEEPAENCIQHTEKGDIIPSDPGLKDAETSIRADERRFAHLKRSCKNVEDEYDYVIMDTPPNIGVVLKNVLHYTDYIVIPVEESGWALSGLMDLADAIDLARDSNPSLRIAGILTIKTKARTNKSRRIGEFAEKIGDKIDARRFESKIRETVACTEALTEFMVPLHVYAPHSTTYHDYEDFTDELLEGIG